MTKIIGIGGAGSAIVSLMSEKGISGVNFSVCNTDFERLKSNRVDEKIFLGPKLTEGLGSDSIPDVGRNSAIESLEEIEEKLNKDTKMLVVIAGMGGGTGTGAAPVISKLAKDLGILTIAVVSTPFSFEGKRRKKHAIEGIENLKSTVDSLIILDNDKLRDKESNLTLTHAFKNADNIIYEIVKRLTEIITIPGYINIDFKDVNLVLKDSGLAAVGISQGSGHDRALTAVSSIQSSTLLSGIEIANAKYIILNIISGKIEVTMEEMSVITDFLQEQIGLKADIIWGNTLDEDLGEDLKIMLLATGFDYATNVKELKESISNIESIILTSDEEVINPNKEILSLYFLEEEYTAEEIAEVISFLSDLYRNEGGDGLVITGNNILEYDSTLQPLLY